MTKEEIQSIGPGTVIQRTHDTGKNSQYGRDEVVNYIIVKELDAKGRLYAVGFAQCGERAEMSFCVREGEHWVRLAQ